MATTPNRYPQLIALLPKGPFFDPQGAVYPNYDRTQEFLFVTSHANTWFGVRLNGVISGEVKTDSRGRAQVFLDLDPGTHLIEIENPTLGNTFRADVSVRESAVWHAAYAEVIEQIDRSLEDVLEGSQLESARADYLGNLHGRLVRAPNEMGFGIPSYRGLIQFLRQAFRWWGGRIAGVRQGVGAYTSASPLLVPRAWRARFVPGRNLVPNGDLQRLSRQLTPAALPARTPLTNISEVPSQSFVHGAVQGQNSFTGPFRNPPYTQPLTVRFDAGWNGGTVTVYGTDAAGQTVSDTFDPTTIAGWPVAGIVAGTQPMQTVTSATFTPSLGNTDTASIGVDESRLLIVARDVPRKTGTGAAISVLRGVVTVTAATPTFDGSEVGQLFKLRGTVNAENEGRFTILSVAEDGRSLTFRNVRAVSETSPFLWQVVPSLYTQSMAPWAIGGGNPPGAGLLEWTAVPSTVAWGGGNAIAIGSSSIWQATLHDPDLTASLSGLNADTFNLDPGAPTASAADYTDRLYLDINGLGKIQVNINAGGGSPTGARTAADVQVDIDNALTADARYGASYALAKNDLTGYGGEFVTLRAPAPSGLLGRDSKITILPDNGTSDIVFGRVKEQDVLVGAHPALATSLQLTDVTPFPAIELDSSGAPLNPYNIRVGRNLRTSGADGAITSASGATCEFNDGTAPIVGAATDVGGWIRIANVGIGANNGEFEVVGINGSNLLLQRFDGASFSNQTAISDWTQWHRGELVQVINRITMTNKLELGGTGLAVNRLNGDRVELAERLPYTVTGHAGLGDITFDVDYRLGLAPTINQTDSPTVVGTGAAAKADVPDGFQAFNVAATQTVLGHLERWRLRMAATGVDTDLVGFTDCALQCAVPSGTDYLGHTLRCTFWVEQPNEVAGVKTFIIEASQDGGATWTNISAAPSTTAGVPYDTASERGGRAPTQVTGTFEILWDATEVLVRLRYVGAAASDEVFVDKVYVTVDGRNGLFLGQGTMSRSPTEAAFGEVIYAWSPEPLSLTENLAIGLPSGVVGDPIDTSAQEGLLDRMQNTWGIWRRFDVSEYDASTPRKAANTKGAYTAEQWSLATKQNVVQVVDSPDRTTYVRPIRVSLSNDVDLGGKTVTNRLNNFEEVLPAGTIGQPLQVNAGQWLVDVSGTQYWTTEQPTREVLSVTGSPGVATLRYASNHAGDPEGTYNQNPNTGTATHADGSPLNPPARLFGDSEPIPDTAGTGPQPWEFTSASGISIDASELGPSVWTIEYQIAQSVTTAVIDLSLNLPGGGLYTDYVWLVDALLWQRQHTTLSRTTTSQQVTFLGDSTAALAIPGYQDKLTATLVADNGITATEVADIDWSWVDSGTIRIARAVFNPRAIYTLTYEALSADQSDAAYVRLEWRSSATNTFSAPGAAPAPAWTTVTPGFVVNRAHQYHQLRATFHNVEDYRDVRLYGLGLRGVHLYGAAPDAPGILIPVP